MFAQGLVIDPSAGGTADGTTATLNLGRANELLVAALHGKYFEHCYRGNVYSVSTVTAGVIIKIASTLTPTFSIWNPAGSGKLMVPIVTLLGWTSTDAALGSFVWTSTTKAGDVISTTGPFVAFGSGTPVNMNLGSGKVSQMKAASGGTTTIVAAAQFYRGTGITALTTAATTTAPWWIARDDWEGMSVIGPGNAIHFMASTAILASVNVSLIYAELPL